MSKKKKEKKVKKRKSKDLKLIGGVESKKRGGVMKINGRKKRVVYCPKCNEQGHY